jgi:hypothetical protein
MTSTTFKLIGLARDFWEIETISIYDLVKQCNYENEANQINEQTLYEELLAYPNFVDDWLQYSDDNRCPGWFFSEKGDGEYLVGYTDAIKEEYSETIYKDRSMACAAYLKRELDSIIK